MSESHDPCLCFNNVKLRCLKCNSSTGIINIPYTGSLMVLAQDANGLFGHADSTLELAHLG